MPFSKADRLQKLPPYLFAEIDRKKKAAIAAGRDVINLGVGDPDRPTPAAIIRSLQQHAENPAFHQYALDQGAPELRQSIARFLKSRYGVDLDPNTEILPTIGSKEALAHLPMAVLNPGDISLVPDPAYPVYRTWTTFAGGEVFTLPLRADNGFKPDFSSIPADIWKRSKLLFLNYPNNPTGATADLAFLKEAVELAHRHDLIVVQDAAYNEMYYDAPPPSILQIDGAKDVAIEFHSLSKTFNMTGWRVGFAVGGAPLVCALAQVNSNTDSVIFTAIQWAAKTALDEYDTITPPIRDLYRQRRDAFIPALRAVGLDGADAGGDLLRSIPCPRGIGSADFCSRLLEEADVVTTPASASASRARGSSAPR
ncbi:MAG: aminotransferase class I/II-fold pyridoxal phosphate-dependent enzyme [Isosphaeraceae bacterium]